VGRIIFDLIDNPKPVRQVLRTLQPIDPTGEFLCAIPGEH
jgi:hypothetical protein